MADESEGGEKADQQPANVATKPEVMRVDTGQINEAVKVNIWSSSVLRDVGIVLIGLVALLLITRWLFSGILDDIEVSTPTDFVAVSSVFITAVTTIIAAAFGVAAGAAATKDSANAATTGAKEAAEKLVGAQRTLGQAELDALWNKMQLLADSSVRAQQLVVSAKEKDDAIRKAMSRPFQAPEGTNSYTFTPGQSGGLGFADLTPGIYCLQRGNLNLVGEASRGDTTRSAVSSWFIDELPINMSDLDESREDLVAAATILEEMTKMMRK